MSDIGFQQIPDPTLVPFWSAEFDGASGSTTIQQATLVIANTITVQQAKPVYCPTPARAVALCGASSLAAQMVEKNLGADPAGLVWLLPMADAGGAVAATGSIAFTGTATAAGTLPLYIAGRSVPVAVPSGMTAAQLATAAVAAITAYLSPNGVALPVTAAVDGTTPSKVDLTAANKGTHGNSIPVLLAVFGAQNQEAIPAGITVAVTALSGGATDPDISGLDAILGDQNYDFIAIPWSTAQQLNSAQALQVSRWAFNRQIYGGVWAAKMDADATGATNLAFGVTRNDPHAVVVSYEPAPNAAYDVAAAFMGAAAASIRADANRNLDSLSVPGIIAPDPTARYSWPTKNALLGAGMALMSYNDDMTCQISRAVTTYQKNAQGVPDNSLRDVEKLYGWMYFIRRMRSDVTNAFPRSKLMDDGTSFGAGTGFTDGLPNQPVATPNSVRSVMIASYSAMVDDTIVEDVATFKKYLVVQRRSTDEDRLDCMLPSKIVANLKVLAVAASIMAFNAS